MKTYAEGLYFFEHSSFQLPNFMMNQYVTGDYADLNYFSQ